MLAAFSLPTIYYIVRRQADLTAARAAVEACVNRLEIGVVDRAVPEAALVLTGSDFEDNLEVAGPCRPVPKRSSPAIRAALMVRLHPPSHGLICWRR